MQELITGSHRTRVPITPLDFRHCLVVIDELIAEDMVIWVILDITGPPPLQVSSRITFKLIQMMVHQGLQEGEGEVLIIPMVCHCDVLKIKQIKSTLISSF